VNLFDALLVLVAAGAAYAGWRQGFVHRALAWIGLGIGVVAGALFVDDIARELRDSTPRTRLLGALAFLVLCAIAGQSIGLLLGNVLRRSLPGTVRRSLPDRLAGACAGVVCVLVGVWLLVPAFANAPGWPARAVRGSAIARAVDRIAPKPPGSLAALGRLVGEAPFPEVFQRLTSPDAGVPPGTGLEATVLARVTPSVVRVDGRACDQLQQGSGVVVADDLVLTNAHVVAGNRATTVTSETGRKLAADVVGFDPARDLALVRARGLALPTPERASIVVDQRGAVLGYPGGGPLVESPARVAEEITADGTDIYRSAATERSVFVLGAELAPGDSGGPLFDRAGRVVGLAFAVDPGDGNTAYALTADEVDAGLRTFLGHGTARAVDTGPCLVG
jgi:S1-C subfamily serine protease